VTTFTKEKLGDRDSRGAWFLIKTKEKIGDGGRRILRNKQYKKGGDSLSRGTKSD